MSRDYIIKRSRDCESGVPPPKLPLLRRCRYKILHLSRDDLIGSSRDLVDGVPHLSPLKEDVIFPIPIPIPIPISMFANYQYST